MRRILGGFVCFFLMLFLVGCNTISSPTIATSTPSEQVELNLNLEEHEVALLFLDLPNGESTVIKVPEEAPILIGTGDEKSRKVLINRLAKFDISEIQALILPRIDEEYSGNTDYLIENFHVKRLIVPEAEKEKFAQKFNRKGLEIIGWDSGVVNEVLPNVKVEVLPNLQPLAPKLSLNVTFAHHHFLFAYEANARLEKNWVDSQLEKVAVLKVAEFGVENSVSQAFLEKIDPHVAILFAKENAVPNSQILERLQETWIDTYQTKQNGTILIKAGQEDYELLTVQFKK